MDNYLIIKVQSEEYSQDYQYILDQFSIVPIIWNSEKKKVPDIITELEEKLHPHHDWNLFIVEFSTLFTDGNPFQKKEMDHIKTLIEDSKFKVGFKQCKPPEKIYLIARKKEGAPAGNGKERLYGFYEEVSICRFIIMACSDKEYLKKIDELKIISTVCLLANNNMPPEIMEAYYVYRISLDINEKMLWEYLKEQRRFLQKEEWDIGKKKWKIENENKRDKESYEEYIPEFSVSAYESLEIQNRFCGVKNEHADRAWLQEKIQRDVKIERLQKEQISKQKEINRIMRKRISLVSVEDIFLEDDEIKKIQKEIEEKQKALNDSYIEVWKMDSDLEREKKESEDELEAALKSRYLWGEIIKVAVMILLFMIGTFGIFLTVEKEIWIEAGIMEDKIPYEWILDNVKYCTKWNAPLIVLFVVFLIISYAYEINSLRKKFNMVMKKMTDQLDNNISHYKVFFALVYSLRVCQNYITRNQNYKLNQKRQMKSLEQRTNELYHAQRNLDLLYKSFKYLDNSEKYDENLEEIILSRKKIYINNEDTAIDNLLYFVENLFIEKEVSDEY